MSYLLSEIFYNITNFLPNDDITDLMLMSSEFNTLVTPRLQKIDQEMSTMNQSIKSFMPLTATDNDNDWIPQLNLKRFEPIGSNAKKAMKKVFVNDDDFKCMCSKTIDIALEHAVVRFKERLYLERFDDSTFLRILGALVSTPKFRDTYNVSFDFADDFVHLLSWIQDEDFEKFKDVFRIWNFYEANDARFSH